ncbi:hypothetical protein GS474_23930 [Rhodococcus hoagii]|nr:hypothetical protein [Prescottella equi]
MTNSKCTATTRVLIDGYSVTLQCEQPHEPGELHVTQGVGAWNDEGEIVKQYPGTFRFRRG